jgi:iron-sulfur cluster repair protein YtfE (RIC family)
MPFTSDNAPSAFPPEWNAGSSGEQLVNLYRCGAMALWRAADRQQDAIGAMAAQVTRLRHGSFPAIDRRRALIVRIGHHFRQDYRWRFGAAFALALVAARSEGTHNAFPHHISQVIMHLDTSVERCASQAFACLAPSDSDQTTEAAPSFSTSIDHAEILSQLDAMAKMTSLYVAPAYAGQDWKTLYAVCQSIDRTLRRHIMLEADIALSSGSLLQVAL